MVASERIARRRKQRRQPRQQLDRRHHAMLRATAPHLLHAARHAPSREPRADNVRATAADALRSGTDARVQRRRRFDAHACVQVEAVALDREQLSAGPPTAQRWTAEELGSLLRSAAQRIRRIATEHGRRLDVTKRLARVPGVRSSTSVGCVDVLRDVPRGRHRVRQHRARWAIARTYRRALRAASRSRVARRFLALSRAAPLR